MNYPEKLKIPSFKIGQSLRVFCFELAPFVAFAYTCGYVLGEYVHLANDLLAQTARSITNSFS
jgi:hypothetical protein